MGLLNVRLDDDDARIARELRADGVQISVLVRHAIRAEHERRSVQRKRRRRPDEIVEAIVQRSPEPVDLPPWDVDVTDRHSVRAAVRKSLLRRHPRRVGR